MSRIEHQLPFFTSCDRPDVCSGRDGVQDAGGDLIHMGHAILTFYSALIDLLGRCAPEMHVSVFSMSAAFTPQQPLMPGPAARRRDTRSSDMCTEHTPTRENLPPVEFKGSCSDSIQDFH